MIMLLRFPIDITNCIRASLKNTVSNVLPALFPFMVLSRFLVTLISFEGSHSSDSKIFGIEKCTWSAVLIGFLSGFPVGGYSVCELYRSGHLGKTSAERALALSHNTGPAFSVSVVGVLLWNDTKFGLSVYISQILAWIIVYTLSSVKPRIESDAKFTISSAPNNKMNIVHSITSAITSSDLACVNITAYIVFWKIIITLIKICFPMISPVFLGVITSVFEFSEGCDAAALIGGTVGAAFTGFSIGFGGLSALMQIYGVANELGLSLKSLVIFKVLQGFVCSAMTGVAYNFILPNGNSAVPLNTTVVLYGCNVNESVIIIITVLIFALIEIFSKRRQSL